MVGKTGLLKIKVKFPLVVNICCICRDCLIISQKNWQVPPWLDIKVKSRYCYTRVTIRVFFSNWLQNGAQISILSKGHVVIMESAWGILSAGNKGSVSLSPVDCPTQMTLIFLYLHLYLYLYLSHSRWMREPSLAAIRDELPRARPWDWLDDPFAKNGESKMEHFLNDNIEQSQWNNISKKDRQRQ